MLCIYFTLECTSEYISFWFIVKSILLCLLFFFHLFSSVTLFLHIHETNRTHLVATFQLVLFLFLFFFHLPPLPIINSPFSFFSFFFLARARRATINWIFVHIHPLCAILTVLLALFSFLAASTRQRITRAKRDEKEKRRFNKSSTSTSSNTHLLYLYLCLATRHPPKSFLQITLYSQFTPHLHQWLDVIIIPRDRVNCLFFSLLLYVSLFAFFFSFLLSSLLLSSFLLSFICVFIVALNDSLTAKQKNIQEAIDTHDASVWVSVCVSCFVSLFSLILFFFCLCIGVPSTRQALMSIKGTFHLSHEASTPGL